MLGLQNDNRTVLGMLLTRFVPEHGAKNAEMRWRIHDILLARCWVMSALKSGPRERAT
jgi:hypothetical protein